MRLGNFFSLRFWLIWFEKMLILSQKRPIVRALIMPLVATHIIPLPLPTSFIIFVVFPAATTAYFQKLFFDSSSFLMLSAIFVLAEIVIYAILVLICIPLTPLILKKTIWFTRYLIERLEKLSNFSQKIISKFNKQNPAL